MNLDQFGKNILKFLRVRPIVGGLEISDTVARYSIWDGRAWIDKSLRLPPNLVQGGKISDYPRFVAAMRELHALIAPKGRLANVVLSLSSVNVYSQVFSLPVIEGENLDKAIQLNIQMVSPAQSSETYSGWQMLGEDQQSVRLEILSSFINREVVDEILRGLREAKFIVHSVESRALSLTRLIRQMGAGFDPKQSYLALSLDSSGLEFLVIRHGQLYFHYFNSWQDLYGAEKQISKTIFEAAIIRNMHQVLNFYNSHWSDPLAGVYISTTALKDDIIRIIQTNFQVNILELQLTSPVPVNPDWYVCLGSALRGFFSQKDDQEISLLGMTAQEEFSRSQLVSFFNFWALLLPVSLLILVSVFFSAKFFLDRTSAALKAESQIGTESQLAEIRNLQSKMNEFNQMVTLIESSKAKASRLEIMNGLRPLATSYGISILHFTQQGPNSYNMTGKAPTETSLRSFTEDVKKMQGVTYPEGWSFPFNQVKTDQDGLSFVLGFVWNPPQSPSAAPVPSIAP